MRVASENNNAVSVQAKTEPSKKKKRRVFEVLQKHKTHNMIKSKKKDSQSKAGHSVQTIKREVNHTAKVLKNMPHMKEKTRKTALQRLFRLHASTKSNKADAKKEEKK